MNRTLLNGLATHAFKSRAEFLSYLDDQKKILVAVNTEKLLNNDQAFRDVVNDNIGYPDGIGAVMALRRKGINTVKIPGAQFWLDIVDRYHANKTFFLVGSTEEVIKLTVEKLKKEYPGIKIHGYRNGYFQKGEIEALKNVIIEKKPDIVFVAMGSPKQEFIMKDFLASHPALYMGLGGSFDLYCGKTKPVPDWWKNTFKWEGIYRCFSDIKNISRWKRQLPALRILYLLFANKL